MKPEDRSCYFDVFETELGWFATLGSGKVVRRIVFAHRNAGEAAAAVLSGPFQSAPQARWYPELSERLWAYAGGESDEFADIELDLAHLSPFSRQVTLRCRQIQYGQKSSYGQLAALAGSPGAARAVGNVMAANRFPLIVPCHRVVNADGTLGAYSAPQGVVMKARLLELEGALERRLVAL